MGPLLSASVLCTLLSSSKHLQIIIFQAIWLFSFCFASSIIIVTCALHTEKKNNNHEMVKYLVGIMIVIRQSYMIAFLAPTRLTRKCLCVTGVLFCTLSIVRYMKSVTWKTNNCRNFAQFSHPFSPIGSLILLSP